MTYYETNAIYQRIKQIPPEQQTRSEWLFMWENTDPKTGALYKCQEPPEKPFYMQA